MSKVLNGWQLKGLMLIYWHYKEDKKEYMAKDYYSFFKSGKLDITEYHTLDFPFSKGVNTMALIELTDKSKVV